LLTPYVRRLYEYLKQSLTPWRGAGLFFLCGNDLSAASRIDSGPAGIYTEIIKKFGI